MQLRRVGRHIFPLRRISFGRNCAGFYSICVWLQRCLREAQLRANTTKYLMILVDLYWRWALQSNQKDRKYRLRAHNKRALSEQFFYNRGQYGAGLVYH